MSLVCWFNSMYFQKTKIYAESYVPLYFIFALYRFHLPFKWWFEWLQVAAGDQVLPLNFVVGPPEASFLLLALIIILFARCRFGGQPGLWRRGSGGEDVLLVRLPGGPDPCRLRPFPLSLHGGDPGGATVRWPVETLPRHWYRNDHHKSRKVNLLWNAK